MKPQSRTIILADQVYRDADTGKCIIAGTFNRIEAESFPATHPQAALYLNLTDFIGQVQLRVRLTRDQNGEALAERAFPVESTDRLGACEVIVRLTNLGFPEPGRYSFEVYAGDDYLGHMPIDLVKSRGEARRGKRGDPKGI